MRLPRRFSAAPAESGFAIIEVLISAVVALTAAAGIAALMQTTVKTASDQRNRTLSYSIAQEDQARIRALRIPSLKTLSSSAGEERKITVDGVKYSVISRAHLVSDTTSSVSCGSSADYFRTSSEVTWTNMRSTNPPTVIRSIIAPPSESIKPKAGNLSIFVEDGFGKGVSAVGISGSGPSTISGSTDASGCALFTEVTEGKYTITPSGTNLVDKDGKPPVGKEISVNPESTATLTLQLAQKGSAPINFQTKGYGTVFQPAFPDTLIVLNNGMTTGSTALGTAGTKLSPNTTGVYTVENLFPFGTTDTFYTGSCIGPNTPVTPSSGNSAILSALVPAGGALSPTPALVMPSVLLTVKVNGTETNAVPVKITDTECKVNNVNVTRSQSTVAVVTSGVTTNGRLKYPELPWGKYEVCASTTLSSKIRREKKTVELKSATGAPPATSVELNLTTSDDNLAC